MKLILCAVLIGKFTITSYRSIPSQTDSSPWITSIGEHVHSHGVAVSQDLLRKNGGLLEYGDTIYIEGFGFKVVNDVMNKRCKRQVDIWVRTYVEEKRVGVKSGRVWIVKPKWEARVCPKPTKRWLSFVISVMKRLFKW
jgi:3D (Asp-Asp-Asp) domain-containing protein